MSRGENHKNNKITLSNVLNSIMISLLDLTEMNYENLVEALPNTALDTTPSTSSAEQNSIS
jgi:hypothetical protein